MLTVGWLGAAGIELNLDGQVLLIDPYLSRFSKLRTLLFPLPPDQEKIGGYLEAIRGRVLAVLVGHTHSDHALDVPEIVRRTGAPALGTPSLRSLLAAYGLDRHAIVAQPGESYSHGPFVSRPARSVHGRAVLGMVPFPGEIEPGLRPPLRASQYRHGGPLAWRVLVGGRSFLHLGSADFLEQELGGTETDVLLVCAAGRQHTPDFTGRLLRCVRPRMVVPFHFDDFSLPLLPGEPVRHLPGVNLDGFLAEIRRHRPEAEILLPKPFEPLGL